MPPPDVQTEKNKGKKRKGNPKNRKQVRWMWSDDMVDKLIECIYEYKIKKDFECKDMESDMQQFYLDIRVMLSGMYPPHNFGPSEVSSLEGADDMEVSAFNALKEKRSNEEKQIKMGYERVKEKIKSVRQSYRNAVNEGTRSGSGRIVTSNWDMLTKIWGGSPAVSKIPNAVNTDMLVIGSDDSEIDEEEHSEEMSELNQQ